MLSLDHDPRIGKAGSYRYCRRCGTLFRRAIDASFHFGDNRRALPRIRLHYVPRIPCSGIPTGLPIQNPAPGARVPNLDYQETAHARKRPR